MEFAQGQQWFVIAAFEKKKEDCEPGSNLISIICLVGHTTDRAQTSVPERSNLEIVLLQPM